MRRWLLVGLTLLSALALDRALPWLIPADEAAFTDAERFHTLAFSTRVRRLTERADSVELVVLGDSRARHGVVPEHLGLPADHTFNLAPTSSGLAFAEQALRLAPLPRLTTVVWGISPRLFNALWTDPVQPRFASSPAIAYRRRTPSLQRLDDALTSVSATWPLRARLKAIGLTRLGMASPGEAWRATPPDQISPTGFVAFPDRALKDMTDPAVFQQGLDAVAEPRFEWAPDRWTRAVRWIEHLNAQGISVLAFTPPMHPALTSSPSADADGTPLEAYERLVAELTRLDAKHPGFAFLDVHRAGHHGYPLEFFADFDHLTRAGAEHLTARLGRGLLELGRDQLAAREAILRGEAPAPMPAPPVALGPTPQKPRPDRPEQATRPTPQGSTSGDQTPPVLETHLGARDYAIGAWPPDNRPTLWVRWRDADSGVDPATVRFYVNGEDVTAQARIQGNRIQWRAERPMEAPKTHRFRVTAQDKAGNAAEVQWSMLIKPC